jgi:hypothetical protein
VRSLREPGAHAPIGDGATVAGGTLPSGAMAHRKDASIDVVTRILR